MKTFTKIIRTTTILIASLLLPLQVLACSQVVVGKEKTTTGSVFISYNNDFTGNNKLSVVSVPSKSPLEAFQAFPRRCQEVSVLQSIEGRQDGSTYPYLQIKVALKHGQIIPEGGLNAVGLAVNFGVYNYPLVKALEADPFVRTGTSYELWDLALQRCRNPECVVNLVEKLSEVCEFSSDVAGSFIAANSTDVWLIEVISGHHWVAAKIPSDKVLLQPNCFRIGKDFDISDTKNWRSSFGLFEFAQRIDPSITRNDFNPAKVFGGEDVPFVHSRIWRMFDLISHSYTTTQQPNGVETTTTNWPTFIKPDRLLVTPQDLFALHRDHYENTIISLPYTIANPHENTFSPLCRAYTTYNLQFRLGSARKEAVMLISSSSPCIGAHVPFFATQTEIPLSWNENQQFVSWETSAFGVFKRVQNQIDSKANGGLRYGEHIEKIRELRRGYERELESAIDDVWISSSVETKNGISSHFAASQLQLGHAFLNEINNP